jgi:hypothetical protein
MSMLKYLPPSAVLLTVATPAIAKDHGGYFGGDMQT